MALPALPRTPNGKLDRNALPAPSSSRPIDSVGAPQTPVEEKIAAIWAEVLGVESVGRADNFFDRGGHSLSGLRLVNQLREALGEHLALAIVFEAPTVARMADFLEEHFPTAVGRWVGTTANASAGDAANLAASKPFASVVPVNRESRRVRREP
jgi:acyl carrier protein